MALVAASTAPSVPRGAVGAFCRDIQGFSAQWRSIDLIQAEPAKSPQSAEPPHSWHFLLGRVKLPIRNLRKNEISPVFSQVFDLPYREVGICGSIFEFGPEAALRGSLASRGDVEPLC